MKCNDMYFVIKMIDSCLDLALFDCRMIIPLWRVDFRTARMWCVCVSVYGW